MKENNLTKVIDAYYQYIEKDLKCKPCDKTLGKSYKFECTKGEISVDRIPLDNGLDLSITSAIGKPFVSFSNTFGVVSLLELGYCISGSMEVTAFPSGKVMKVSKGDAFFSRLDENTTRYDSFFNETIMLSIHFDEALLKGVNPMQWRTFIKHNFGSNHNEVKTAHPSLRVRAEEIVNQSQGELMSYLRIKQSVLGFIVDYFDYQIVSEKNQNDIIHSVKESILENPSEKITIDRLKDKFQMSEYLIQKLFKDSTGKTVYQFIKQFKLELAKTALLQTDKSIIEISNELGYENASKFAHSFFLYTGYTPKRYRSKNK